MPPPFENSDEERTESASQFRREEFRKQGTVAFSREVLSVVVMAAVGMSLYTVCSISLREFGSLSHNFFEFGREEFSKELLFGQAKTALRSGLWMLGPALAISVLAALLASAAQVGLFVTWEPLVPNWDRINPIRGFQRLFSSQGLVEAAKAIVKIGIVGWVFWIFLKSHMGEGGLFMEKEVAEGTVLGLSLIAKLFFTLVVALAAIAVSDYAYQRYQLEKNMRMTRREVKEEFKLREGDPLIKTRIRNIQRRLASRRMMDSVAKSDVVVTNPTHFAVALQYNETMVAPKCTAKGVDLVALRIRAVAVEHGIPIVENKPLARALYKDMEIGQSVPRELYRAVAEVLGYVYRLRSAATA